MKRVLGKSGWTTYDEQEDHKIDIKIVKLDIDRYFVLINGDNLCGLENKQAFLRDAVERALKAKKIDVSFKDVAVGGVVTDEGRLGFYSKLKGETPPAVHEYAAFKIPGEEYISIEDPRTGIFDINEKLQSRTDNQVCCFAAFSIFYLCYKSLQKRDAVISTRELFRKVYDCSELRVLIQGLEKKVGRSMQTKEEVIKEFINQIRHFEIPSVRKEAQEDLKEVVYSFYSPL